GNGASVRARGDVDVHALSDKDLTSFAVSAAAGDLGLGGAVSVLILGANLDSDSGRAISANDGSGGSVDGYGDGNLLNSGFSDLLGAYSSDDGNGAANDVPDNTELVGNAAADAQSSVNAAVAAGQITNAVKATDVPAGVSAFVGDQAVVAAGGSLDVEAQE